MSTHKHTYQRLSDDAVFCRDCGDIKRSEPPVCTLPHYQFELGDPDVPSSGTSDTRLWERNMIGERRFVDSRIINGRIL